MRGFFFTRKPSHHHLICFDSYGFIRILLMDRLYFLWFLKMKDISTSSRSIRKQMLFTLALLILLGLLSSWYNIHQLRKEMESELLQKARVAAHSLNTNRLNTLTGTLKDTTNPDYLRLKSQLYNIRTHLPTIRFLYILAKAPDGKIIIITDSQDPTSKNYAPPGMIYTEVPQPYLSAMNRQQDTIVGPVEDRWGQFMTALVPLKVQNTSLNRVTLGMDIPLQHWTQWSLLRTLPILVLIVIIILLIYYIQQMRLVKNRRITRKQIAKQEERYRALFENAADGILIGNQQGIIIDANQSICSLTGYARSELIGSNIVLLFDEETLQKSPFKYSDLIAGKTVRNERILTRKDKTKVFIEMNTRIVSDGRLQTFIRDITKRKENEQVITCQNGQLQATNKELRETNNKLFKQKEELKTAKEKAEESDRLKTAFLANMSHEIRTPMNGIIGFSEAFKETNNSAEDRERYADIVIKSSKQLLTIVNDILDISLLETGKLPVQIETVNINRLLLDLYKRFEKEAKNKEIDLYTETSLPDEKCNIMADPYRLRQVVSNLLSNALKFTNKGHIVLGYKIKQQQIGFFVEDTGIGIAKEQQARVFDRFWQEETNIARQFGGTGLGLSISQKLVTLMGGQIGFTSEKHKGSNFYFWLPLTLSEPADQQQEVPALKLPNGSKILIAEDEDTNFLYLKEILEAYYEEILWAKNGKEAVNYTQEHANISVVLMDIKMPLMNGFEALKVIKRAHP
ncbi:MAG: ATP-binding protein, partial [Bacteroidota bacterium]